MNLDPSASPHQRIDLGVYEPLPLSLPFDRFSISGNLVFVSGHIPDAGGSRVFRGIVDQDLGVDDARAAARQACMGVINALTGAVTSLEQVTKVVRLTGYVACTPAFREQPQVINAASELMLEIFGPVVGRHARSALGVAGLPLGAPVEVEAIFEVKWES